MSMGEDKSEESASEGGDRFFWGVVMSLRGTGVAVALVARKVRSSLFVGFAASFLGWRGFRLGAAFCGWEGFVLPNARVLCFDFPLAVGSAAGRSGLPTRGLALGVGMPP
jgi:hypothetical protein